MSQYQSIYVIFKLIMNVISNMFEISFAFMFMTYVRTHILLIFTYFNLLVNDSVHALLVTIC